MSQSPTVFHGETIIGIDPGASGGIAWIGWGVGEEVCAIKMPDTEGDISGVIARWSPENCVHGSFAYIEKVGPARGRDGRKQGVSSSFKFGKNVGMLLGVLTAFRIPFEEVSPQRWQKSLGCLSKGDKNVTKRKAQQLFPHLKITHATADALLIAEYGRRLRQVTVREIG